MCYTSPGAFCTRVRGWWARNGETGFLAFRYLALGWEELADPPKKTDVLAEIIKPKTLNDVLREYEAEQEDD